MGDELGSKALLQRITKYSVQIWNHSPMYLPRLCCKRTTVGLLRKEFASISCIAVSARTGFALIFVLEYCALYPLQHNVKVRIMANWRSGLTHQIFILALAGSNPVFVTNEHHAPLAVRGSILE